MASDIPTNPQQASERRVAMHACFVDHKSEDISRGADRGPRAPPLGLNPMHILLYPRVWTAEKIMLTGKKLVPKVHTRHLFKETPIQHNSENFRGMVTNCLRNFVMPAPILANLVSKCSWWFTLSACVKTLLILLIMTSPEVKRSRANQSSENLPILS